MPDASNRPRRTRDSAGGEPLPAQPYPETSYEYQNASEVEDEEDIFDDSGMRGQSAEAGEGHEEGDAASETSSAMLDPVADPAGFAKRLNELAGELEVAELEARAIRWGPAISTQKDAPILPISDFKALINHHLAATEWRYAADPALAANGPSNALALPSSAPSAGVRYENHPIRVMSSNFPSADQTDEAAQADNAGRDEDVQMTTTPR